MKCSRCPALAFLRVDGQTVLCADCWNAIEAKFIEDLDNSNTAGVSLKVSPDVATAAPVSQPRSSKPAVASFPDLPDYLRRSSQTTSPKPAAVNAITPSQR